MSADPELRTVWNRPEAWARPDRIHPIDCDCRPCRQDRARPHGPAAQASAWSTWTLAGVALGNLLAFAYDWRGAAHALAVAIGAAQ